MWKSDELSRTIERNIKLRRQLSLMIAECAKCQRERERGRLRADSYLLAITERLIDAHRIAKLDGDGMTVDTIQDALLFVGRRLARETKSDGRSARAILGYWHG